MAKYCAIFFGVIGYLIAAWYYTTAFSPISSEAARNVIWNMCLSCLSISGVHSKTLRLALLVLSPINAIIYAALGFVAARLILALRGGTDGKET